MLFNDTQETHSAAHYLRAAGGNVWNAGSHLAEALVHGAATAIFAGAIYTGGWLA